MAEQAPETLDAAALLARLDALRQAERRAASARMVSVAGHLIGTPLNVIAGRAALIRSNPAPEAVEENVRRIEEQVERLAMRIRRLIDYFGMPDPSDLRVSVGEVLRECEALYRPIAEVAGVTLQVSAQGVDPLRIEASVPPLVLTTLLSLAIRSSAAGKTVQLNATEHGPKTIVFELTLPDLPAPPANFERLEPPEHSLRYDAGALETFWICLGLARRIGGTLSIEKAQAPVGVTVRFECAHG
jgi:two-component system, NtrC family, sensor kinase